MRTGQPKPFNREGLAMAWWQYALIAFVVAWVLQAYGVWRQTRHYQAIFSELRKTWSDGALGAGAAPSRLGKGVIALVVAGPDRVVRTVRVMQGRSVFAKFVARSEFDGLTIAELKARIEAQDVERGVATAIGKALEQIDKIESRNAGAAGSAAGAALKPA